MVMKILKRFKKWQKILLLILAIILVIEMILIVYKVCAKYIFDDSDKVVETIKREKLDLDNYNYYINSNASEYQKELFEELKTILSKEEIDDEEYATVLAKMFVSDLFTLNSKNSSNDITSSQYVYDSYQETFESMVKDTIYASIEINIDGEREQILPTVKGVEVIAINRDSFELAGEVIDDQAFYVTVGIEYDKDLEYPINYEVVLVKKDNLLQVVKANEA